MVVFSHGWNNDEAAATSLYGHWFGLLAAQVDPNRKIGYVGIRWPAQLWRDEPIPDFDAAPGADHQGAAALDETAAVEAGSPTIDPAQLADLKQMFPNGSEQLDTIAGLLAQPPAPGRAAELFTAMREFSAAAGVKSSDGEAPEASKEPGMLDKQQDPDDVFTRFADRLADAGVEFGDGGGEAGLGDFASKLLHGAKEALRQLTYWQMKNRAGVVGQKGMGPAIDRLADEFPSLRIHLIGHSFGARVVSFALAGMRESAPSPVKSVTLLQGAYSRFAFAPDLPFGGRGALEGKLARIDGPLTVCFSSHDGALGSFTHWRRRPRAMRRRASRIRWRGIERWDSWARSVSSRKCSARSAQAIRSRLGRSSIWMPPMSSSRATPRREHTATFSTHSSPGWLPRPVA